MKGFKEPSHQDRIAAASKAKNKVLAKLKAVPKPDEAELAAMAARREQREAKAEAKRAAAREARLEKQRLAQEKRAAAKQERAKTDAPKRSEAELKAARDARYAARKARK
ncbi:hypothetical protein FGU71_08705 [Erythrobacter insulae]|uniref:Uncharacterized protein n=1 Tax=Erythrobacter insulae TaxID=2584124 RepID=A0A547PCS5_9SPHN|nr:DUF6481 family protein [Erythrobacter insulae]TRD11925.1 hypothetical protein FGU71_08705 [Erythrobacter insulae]